MPIRNVNIRIVLILALICLGVPAVASMDPEPAYHITFDDTAVRQLIALMKAKDASDSSLDLWLDLPANKYLLKIGEREQNLTREQLKKNAASVIEGTATPENQPPMGMGSLWMASPSDYIAMLDQLDSSEKTRVALIADRLKAFTPKGVDISETVYIHLGGDWDSVNDHGTIYLNMRYWVDRFRRGWDGINMIVAHETTHTLQNATYGNPEEQGDGPSAFLTGLSKLQREGTARYVEYDTDPGPYLTMTYGFYERALDTESHRAFPSHVKMLQPLYDACFPTFDHDKFVNAYQTGVDTGGPYYDIGYGVAEAIDTHLGRKALINTIVHGPKLFFTQYIGLCATDPELPKLPADIIQAVEDMPDKV